MKVRTTLEFSDEERLAVGRGEKAKHGIMQEWVSDVVAKARPELLDVYRKAEIAKLKEEIEELEALT
jgi:hypothetical protein